MYYIQEQKPHLISKSYLGFCLQQKKLEAQYVLMEAK